jgi:hypothetical protein
LVYECRGLTSFARRRVVPLPSIRGEHLMQTSQNRRRFLATLSATGAAGLIGLPHSKAEDGRLETTTVRIAKGPSVCVAPT